MPELYPEDQEKVDRYLRSNVNDVERKAFRPLLLLTIIIVVLVGLTGVAFLIAKDTGVV